MKTQKILKAEIKCQSRGKESSQRYRAVLMTEDGKPSIKIDQEIKGNWHGTYSWYLETLLERRSDFLWLDYGAQWAVTGMEKALDEAEELTK